MSTVTKRAASGALICLLLSGCSKLPTSISAPVDAINGKQVVAGLPAAKAGRSLTVSATTTTLSVSASQVSMRHLLAAVAAAGDIDVAVYDIPDYEVTLTVPNLPTGEALQLLAGDLRHKLSRSSDGRWRLQLGEPSISADAATLRSLKSAQEPPAAANAVVTEFFSGSALGSGGVAFAVAEQRRTANRVSDGLRKQESATHSEPSLHVLEESFVVGSSLASPPTAGQFPASSVSPFGRR